MQNIYLYTDLPECCKFPNCEQQRTAIIVYSLKAVQ